MGNSQPELIHASSYFCNPQITWKYNLPATELEKCAFTIKAKITKVNNALAGLPNRRRKRAAAKGKRKRKRKGKKRRCKGKRKNKRCRKGNKNKGKKNKNKQKKKQKKQKTEAPQELAITVCTQ